MLRCLKTPTEKRKMILSFETYQKGISGFLLALTCNLYCSGKRLVKQLLIHTFNLMNFLSLIHTFKLKNKISAKMIILFSF